MLAFTSVYFLESGLFNGLRPIQIKKPGSLISGCIHGVLTAADGPNAPFLLAVGWQRATRIRGIELIARIPFFQKNLSTFEFERSSAHPKPLRFRAGPPPSLHWSPCVQPISAKRSIARRESHRRRDPETSGDARAGRPALD